MFADKAHQLIESLETQELEAPNGALTSALYAELFAAYLLVGDLSSARYLWKRLPDVLRRPPTSAAVNAADPVVPAPVDLPHIWPVYQALWLSDMPAFFAAAAHAWTSPAVAELMVALRERVRRQTVELVALAYSSIFEDRLQQLVQLDAAQLEAECRALGWQFEEGPAPRLVRPRASAAQQAAAVDAEQQLAKLTDFVSFLEN